MKKEDFNKCVLFFTSMYSACIQQINCCGTAEALEKAGKRIAVEIPTLKVVLTKFFESASLDKDGLKLVTKPTTHQLFFDASDTWIYDSSRPAREAVFNIGRITMSFSLQKLKNCDLSFENKDFHHGHMTADHKSVSCWGDYGTMDQVVSSEGLVPAIMMMYNFARNSRYGSSIKKDMTHGLLSREEQAKKIEEYKSRSS